MRIVVRDQSRRLIGRIEVDPAARPTRASVAAQPRPPRAARPEPQGSREVFLQWDTALDDSGQLRRCVACGCSDLFKEKSFPQVTAFIVVLAFIGAIAGALGLANSTPVLIAMAVILVIDVAILLLSRRRLVCYQCRSSFHDLPIARYHRSWDRSMADRHPALRAGPAPQSAPAAAVAGPSSEPVASAETNYFAS